MSRNFIFEKIVSIEAFKVPGLKPLLEGLCEGGEPKNFFRSSGTTSEDRSYVCLSEHGLNMYKSRAIRDFSFFLERYFPGQDCRKIPGLILVPHANQSPHSSLSQMMTWISEEFTAKFVEYSELATIHSSQPVWIFGTGFDYWNLSFGSAKKLQIQVNSMSLLVSTGGLKSTGIEMSNHAIASELSKKWLLPAQRFAGEYGMCELTCQAYTLPEGDSDTYQFSDDIRVAVLTENLDLSECGCGSLVVYDPLRVDFPFSVLTQDKVELGKDRTFKILGRVKNASLKGCSLTRMEELKGPAVSEGMLCFSAYRASICEDSDLQSFIFNPDEDVTEVLKKEFSLAEWSRKFLEEYFRGMKKAFQITKTACPENLIFIPSSTHSFSQLYPIVYASRLGHRVYVRDPFHKNDRRFFHLFLQKFFGDSYERVMLPKSFRLDDQCKWLTGPTRTPVRIIVSSSRATREDLFNYFKDVEALEFNFFSEVDSSAWIKLDELNDPEFCSELLYQSFSLNQSGCRNPKVLFVVCDGLYDIDSEREKIFQKAVQSLTSSCSAELLDRLSEYRATAVFSRGMENLESAHSINELPLRLEVLKKDISVPDFYTSVNLAARSRSPFSLPICLVSRSELENEYSKIVFENVQKQTLSYIAASDSVFEALGQVTLESAFGPSKVILRRLFDLQLQEWDGTMDGQVIV